MARIIVGTADSARDVARVLALSDERDLYEERILAAWREGYQHGYQDGIARCSVWNAELYSDEQAELHWRESVRNLNADRRDQKLLTRIKEKRAKGERICYHEQVILYHAQHPEVIWDSDPRMRPHGEPR